MLKNISCYTVLVILLFGCSQKNTTISNDNDKVANDLINETSPYLLQHAYNPVKWKAWNDKSLQVAKDENKLIIVSVGYSACHWCHVMEEESFENDSVAKLMNENFINIKVDREERPDVDQVYMNAVQLMTGSGGWPLNCITLPDGRPVFGGTYFTKVQWIKILKEMSELYKANPDKVISYAEKLTEGVKNSDLITVKKEPVQFNAEALEIAVEELKKSLDYKFGGQKGEPKFPMPTNLNFLLRYSFHNNDEALKKYVLNSLDKIANGGIYDHVGGGFSRYAVDEKWHIPHFEKMLYDNAQLVSIYSKAYKLTKNENYKRVINETLSFVDSEFSSDEGAFFSSLDADSGNDSNELKEGAYYVWSEEELKIILGEDFNLFKHYYNINATNRWEEGKYVLSRTLSDEDFAKNYHLSITTLDSKRKSWKDKLNKERSKRSKPRLDDKVLTSWNAMMVKAYVDAFNATGHETYLNRAINNANFIKNNQLKKDGSLYHSYKDGKSTIEGFSEDYAHSILAFIELYQATLNEEWLITAKDLMDYSINYFLDKETSMFYFTKKGASNLIARKTDVYDGVIPSSNSILAENLFKLGHYFSNNKYLDLANQMLKNVNDNLIEVPSGFTNWLFLYLNYSNPYYEVAISGENAKDILKEFNTTYIPNILVSGSITESDLPLLKNKFNKEETLVYVCVNGTCKLPVNTTEKALSQILK